MRGLRLALPLVALGLSGACGSVPVSSPPTRAPAPRPPEEVSPLPSRGTAQWPAAQPLAQRVVRHARALLETPYRYAGSDPSGFDCSGLTVFVYRQVGLALPRTARDQSAVGRWVAPDELAPGDLVFFGEVRDKPFHVGVVVSEPGAPLTMIHSASSRGVTETEVVSSSYWLRRLRFGRRVLVD